MIAGSYRRIPLRRTRSSFNVTAIDSTGRYVRVYSSVTSKSTPGYSPAQRPDSGVANGLFATRFLPT